jgi:gliding motility-associated-like protein
MQRFLTLTIFFFLLKTTLVLAQTEGWSSTCSTDAPSVSEVMIDACGDEFKSEYVVLKTGNRSFDVRNFVMTVVNPFNTPATFIGSVSVQNNNFNADAIRLLNEAATTTCGYGTVFRDALHTPYDGIIPPNSTVLLFNNKDSTDVSYLSPGELSRLCGSKVFVVFGTLNPQSRGVSIFRNYPQNGSCGTTGCLRQIQFQFGGATTPFCTRLTYDIKKLSHLNTTNPPAGFNEGSYIRPGANDTLIYGGGNLTGTNEVCMPQAKLMCNIPTLPDYGDGFWNVLAFDGFNDWSNGSFKGYYQGKGNQTLSVGTATADNFEFNTVRDGWGGTQSPSEAHASIGALATYNGCNTRADSFSILAKRKGFTCGYYDLTLNYYDDFARIRIDNNGDGTWDFDQSYSPPACNVGCKTTIWQGFLSPQSKIEIYGYDLRGNFNVHVLFQRRTTPPSVKINVLAVTPVVCGGPPTGSITTTVTGGITPYNIVWSGASSIPIGSLSATNLPSGLFQMKATDGVGCVDSVQILVPQTNGIVVTATGDTAFCPGGTAILRGAATGATGLLRVEWLTTASPTVLATGLNYSPVVSKSTDYVLRITDGVGCFKTDTVSVKVHSLPVIHGSVSPNDTVCNDAVPILRAKGAQSYTWASFPPIGAAALDAKGDSARLFSLFLPAPYYIFTATGTDGNGCTNTGQAVITLVPLPVVTISPVSDTLCDDGAPRPLTFSPLTGGNLNVYLITPAANIPCPTCVENGVFYPTRSGAGDFLVVYDFVNTAGCRNSPSIHVNVKNCRCSSSVTTPLSKNICQGDSFRIKTIFYKTTGTYRDTFRKTDGCDSVIVLSLAVNKFDTTRVVLKTCNPASVGTTSQILRNQYGCDSLVITTKTFGRHDTTRYTYLICVGDSVLVNNVWIKRAGETRFNLLNAEGCDSIVIANIALTKHDTTLITTTSCDPTRVGIDSVHKTNRFGCDSLVITRTTFALKDTTRFQTLTCNPALVGNDVRVYRNRLGCDSIVINATILRKTDTTFLSAKSCNPLDTGTKKIFLQNQYGCDSLILLQTSLKRRDSTRLNWFICESDSLAFDSRWIKTRGTYFETRTNSLGCDSVLVLTLDFWKKDTTILQKTSCNPLLVGNTTKILRGYRGCDSVVMTQTRLVITDMKDSLTVLKSISCNGLSDGGLAVKISSGGRTPFSYNWTNGATAAQNNNIRAGLYRVTITDTDGCQLVDSFVLKNPPPLSISIVGVPPICYGDNTGSIKITSFGGGIAPYRFTYGASSQNLTAVPTVLTSVQRGSYRFKLIDGAGCAFDSTVTIPLGIERKLDIGADRTIELGDSTLLVAFFNFAGSRIKWTTRDGFTGCDSCNPILVKPLETTTYKLSIKDTSGCELTDDVTVFVQKSRHVFIPTSFTPNDDGINDHFTAFTDRAVRKIQTLKVFNRWGSPLFEQNNFLPNDETQGWDGKWHGGVLPPDVYVFFMRIEFEDGKVGVYQGDVTIMK